MKSQSWVDSMNLLWSFMDHKEVSLFELIYTHAELNLMKTLQVSFHLPPNYLYCNAEIQLYINKLNSF